MTQRSKTGKLGEDIACKYLAGKGYKIIERNHRQKWGEIDIVSIDPRGMLALVEVKTVRGLAPYISGEDQMTKPKVEKFKRVAHMYANSYLEKSGSHKGWQLDLVTVNLNGNNCRLKHYKNIS